MAARPSLARAKWALYVDIYEPAGAGMGYPVLRHIFYGKTKTEAQGYYDAHLTTDTFFAGCVLRGRFGDFDCRSFQKWERL